MAPVVGENKTPPIQHAVCHHADERRRHDRAGCLPLVERFYPTDRIAVLLDEAQNDVGTDVAGRRAPFLWRGKFSRDGGSLRTNQRAAEDPWQDRQTLP